MNLLRRTHGSISRHDRCLLNSVENSNQDRDVTRQALRTLRNPSRGRRVARAPSRPEKASCFWTRNVVVTKRVKAATAGSCPSIQ
jgi:hypothetical protein